MANRIECERCKYELFLKGGQVQAASNFLTEQQWLDLTPEKKEEAYQKRRCPLCGGILFPARK